MDGKPKQTAERPCGAGDTSYLQRELGQVLPVALAAVTELHPSDPITILALWLYKYRELNPPPAVTSDITVVRDSSKCEPPPSTEAVTVTASATEDTQRTGSIHIVQNYDDCDDFIEDSGYLGSAFMKVDIHREVAPMLSNIGDLFDDDDLG